MVPVLTKSHVVRPLHRMATLPDAPFDILDNYSVLHSTDLWQGPKTLENYSRTHPTDGIPSNK